MAPQDAPRPDRRVARAGLPLRVANPNPVQPFYRRIAVFAGWLLRRLTVQDWDDARHLPLTGGVIVVANHISNADPVVVAHYLIWSGRWPRFLAKSQLWSVPLVGRIVAATGQIPVRRGTHDAATSLAAARDALRAGECVLVYPEGTITTDPDDWPMSGYPGAARLALATGAPLVPVGQWGARLLLGGKKPAWPRLVPRPVVVLRSGPAVDLSDLAGREDEDAVGEATGRMMAAITAEVAGIRGVPAPADRFDPRLGRRVPRPPAVT
ncbi:MAG: lysophospholipid acyltransferase family protein [Propionicimonas sp.]|nr:lysophospholipid acyltransferase family protein [Propionicimonas sp.]